jgi:hypothetical protein
MAKDQKPYPIGASDGIFSLGPTKEITIGVGVGEFLASGNRLVYFLVSLVVVESGEAGNFVYRYNPTIITARPIISRNVNCGLIFIN